MTFDDLVAEGVSVPVEGWDFSWFEGRATEERPPWGYAALVAERASTAASLLDLDTGGGEVVHWSLEHATRAPGLVIATELWAPNAALARDRLAAHGATVVRVGQNASLPFRDGVFELVSSRHPVSTEWAEVARVLCPGGHFLSQQIGPGSNRGLYEFLMGPQPGNPAREPSLAVAEAEANGLEVLNLRIASLEVVFLDVAAVIVFLRKVIWTVPDFTVERYRDELRALHEQIQQDERFVCHSQRFLIEARKN